MNKTFQFSKIIVSLCFCIMIIGISATIYLTIFYSLDSTIGAAAIALCGTLAATAEVFYLKKAQAENTLKIYLSTYKEILELKNKISNDQNTEIFNEMENNITSKISNTLDIAINDATYPIERQDVL